MHVDSLLPAEKKVVSSDRTLSAHGPTVELTASPPYRAFHHSSAEYTREPQGKMDRWWTGPSLVPITVGLDVLMLSCLPEQLLATAGAAANHTEQTQLHQDVTRNKIITAQFECYQKIMKNAGRGREGTMCNSTWDGWLCWDDEKAGSTSHQPCPDYYNDFDTSEMATKICTESGHWFLHPESNRTWSNYTRCNKHTIESKMTALNLLYLALIGHGLSLASLFISLGIFFHFKSLSCQRITLHKNLFFSFMLNSVITIIWLTAVANNQELVQQNLGIYLHTLIVVAVFAEKQHLMWYYLLGWGFPLIPALIHAVARSYYYNDNCWISSNTSLLYIIHGPICAALLVNLFFLLNIVRVLITKLKVTHQTESSLYMKAVRATLILVPLLGIQHVLLPYKPQERQAAEIYDYVMNISIHFQVGVVRLASSTIDPSGAASIHERQEATRCADLRCVPCSRTDPLSSMCPQGLLVATIFCFFNGEVQGVLKRHWNQHRIQFGSTLSHPDILRSASYTISTISEVHGCYSFDGHTEHLNGKGCYDTKTAIYRSENPFA
ncbi:calcitonin gene-related peptide type 1 receptor precursor-like [Scleropages formosus]|uniref:Calcitonin gene-related peptide type 1 receptor n=1 Tax=Scleropages formosus TaxID=113540 RepID=A0A0P7WIG9_SCLFO|nr:calcitonin gene-related peptide type 1 receptor precursor-like [Scleropages formosus]